MESKMYLLHKYLNLRIWKLATISLKSGTFKINNTDTSSTDNHKNNISELLYDFEGTNYAIHEELPRKDMSVLTYIAGYIA